ncbi:MAG: xanthine dehydrogenase family protein subunit M [Chloroflexota bacterium]|nr:xanthine dehydrogenase family protein subunit M [Chloroflexota bacterium]MDQ5864141.1 xanthine dehydrogenase family protein subunit M [Chloroflexota bacterium]
MQNFNYVKADSLDFAVEALGVGDGTSILAGGTDLVPLMKDELATPNTLIDISGLDDLNYVEERDGKLHIGATTPLSDLAANPILAARYSALAEACRLAATPQLRNMSTIAGNLLQQPRCWYYRGEHNCWLKGGELCYARNGENELHAIFLNSPPESRCVSVHPSDPAVALLLFDAVVRFRTGDGESETPIGDFYDRPTPERRNSVVLPAGAVITEIVLEAVTGRSTYLKAMPRASWAFALASVGIALQVADGRVEDARVSLGGVAPVPLRFPRVEALLEGQAVALLDADLLAEALVAEATPLSKNGYKVPLLRGLFKQALSTLIG